MSADQRHPHTRGQGMASARSRERLIDRLASRGEFDELVLAAMNRVPRHEFVDEAMASRAYDDSALPIGHGQTISQPTIVAEMTTLAIADGIPDRVLEIGTGSGYQSAVLAELGARVVSVECVEPLYRLARRRLAKLGYTAVDTRFAAADTIGLPREAPFDLILVTAGADRFPDALFDQLADGGCMIIPLAEAGYGQRLYRIRRQGNEPVREALTPVAFVPLVQPDPG